MSTLSASNTYNIEIRIKLIPFARIAPAKGFHSAVATLLLKLIVIHVAMVIVGTSLNLPAMKTAKSLKVKHNVS